jgi:DNA invertase Pin-like site-specific DNA recombinase
MPPSPVAYSYVRFSHPDQAKGDSLRRQTEAAAAWCEKNHVALDASLTLHDLGKSAYTGEHRKNPDRHALAAFLKLVEAGKVPKGSYFIIENLDRLSREDERPALRLWMDILDAGVNIVQLRPETIFRHEKSDMFDIMRAVIELSRGHGESARKSERVGDAWAEKKARARRGEGQKATKRMKEGDQFITRRLPFWVEERSGKLALVPGPAKAMRRIFELARSGYGSAGTVKKLTEEGVPPFGESDHWTRTYVSIILKDRRALGEFQPRRHDGEPDGEPIKNYFPAVATEEEWLAAQAGAGQRRRCASRGRNWTKEEDALVRSASVAEVAKRLGRSEASVRMRRNVLAHRASPGAKNGKKETRYVNVFSGLLKDAHNGGAYYVSTRSSAVYGSSWRVLLNVASAEGREPARSFPFGTFEREVLRLMAEIDPKEIVGGNGAADEVMVLTGQLSRVESSIAAIEAELEEHGESPTLFRRLRAKEEEKRRLVGLLAEARQKAAHPLSAAWAETQTLIEALDSAPDPTDARLRLRSAMRRIVDSIYLLPVARGRDRVCVVQVWFAGGKRHPDYLIFHRSARAGGRNGGSTPGHSSACSLADVMEPGKLDLRKPDHARRLEKALAALPLDEQA